MHPGWCPGLEPFFKMCFPCGSTVKNLLQCVRPKFDRWIRKIPWRRKWPSTPVFLPREFQYACLENSMDRGAWRAIVRGVTKSWMQPSDYTFTLSSVFIHTERNTHAHTSFPQEPHLSWDFILRDPMCEFWNRVERMKSASQRRTSFTLSQSCLSNYLYTSAFSVDGNLEAALKTALAYWA